MSLESPVTYIDDLVITNPTAGDPRSEGDDHIRNIKNALKNTFPGLGGRAWRWQTKAINYTVAAADNLTMFNIATTGITLAGTAAATLGNGHFFGIHANGFDVTFDPSGAETVNGAATLVVPNGMVALIGCNGTGFIAILVSATAFASPGTLTPSQITADQNDYNPTGLAGTSVLRLSTDAARTLTGLAGGTTNRLLALYNVGSFRIILARENSSSSAANRFTFNADTSVFPGQGILLQYDAVASRWRCISPVMKAPSVTVLTSGTAATYTTPTGATRLRVRLYGPGGGGGAQDTNNGAAGSAATTFGASLSAGAGAGGGTNSGAPGAGGTASNGDVNVAGGGGTPGISGATLGVYVGPGGNGGVSPLGGAGRGGNNGTAGSAAATNSGSGGGGGGPDNGTSSGSGGGAGGYVEKLLIAPDTTYTYTIGTGGAGGAAGTRAGGNGAAGQIIVEEFYD